MTNRSQERGESSNANELKVFWKRIWKLEVSAVVKNFVWKLGNNLLPTKELLVQKHIGQDPYCPFYLSNTESASHIIWECQSSKGVWQECSRRVQKLSMQVSDGFDFLFQLFSKLEDEAIVEEVTVARLIWIVGIPLSFAMSSLPPIRLLVWQRSRWSLTNSP